MQQMRRLTLAFLMAIVPAATPADEPVSPVNPVEIREWPIEAGGRPRDPFAAGHDTVWFVGQAGSYIGRLTPSTGAVAIRPLEDKPGPHNLIVGSDGIVWYAGNLDGYIGRYDPETDVIGRIEMPDKAAHDPHTLVFDSEETAIWFTVQNGNFVGRLSLDDLGVALVEVSTPNARPYGIKIAPDGMVWVALLGTNRLASVDPGTMTLEEHQLPAADARPRRLEVTRRGDVWYADYRRGTVGRYRPGTGAVSEWVLPGGSDSAPYGTALDSEGMLWVVETGPDPNRMIGFDTGLEEIVSVTPIPSGAGTVRHMHYFDPENEVWFGTDASTIGRVKVGRH